MTRRLLNAWFAAAPPIVLLAFWPGASAPFEIKNVVWPVLAAVLLVFWSLDASRLHRPATLPWVGALLLVAGAVLARGSAFVLAQILGGVAVFIVLLTLEEARRQQIQRTFSISLAITATVIALFALKQLVLPEWLDPGFIADGKLSIYSTLGNPTYVALVLVAALPITVMLRRPWALVAAAVQLGGLAATQSRHGYFAIVVLALVVAGVFAARRMKRGWITAAAVGGLFAAIGVWQVTRFREIVWQSIEGRLLIWRTSLAMIADQPFLGYGPGRYIKHHLFHQAELFRSGELLTLGDNAAVVADAHNELLNAWVTCGLLGVVGWVAILAAGLYGGHRVPGFVLGLVGVIVMMLFTSALEYAPVVLVFFSLAGICAARETVELRVPRRVLAVAATVLVIALGGFAVGPLKALAGETRGDRAAAAGDPFSARQHYQAAHEHWPTYVPALHKLALAAYLDGDLPAARGAVAQARRYSNAVGLVYLEAELLGRQRQLTESMALYRLIADAFPSHVHPHFMMGQILLEQGHPEGAREELEIVLTLQPSRTNRNLTHAKVEEQRRIARRFLEAIERDRQIGADAAEQHIGQPGG